MQEESTTVMSEPKPIKRKAKRTLRAFVWRFTLKIVRNLFILVFSTLILATVFLQFPFFQTILVHQVLDLISEKMGFKIETSQVSINYINGTFDFKNLSIRDLQDKQMIFTEELFVNIDYSTVAKNGDVYIKEVKLKRGSVNLMIDKKTGWLNIDQFIELIDSLTAPKVRNPNATPTKVEIGKAEIIDTYFSFSDNRKPISQEEGFDPVHFGIDEMNAQIQNLKIVGDSIEVQINGLRGVEYKSKLRLKNLTTLFRFTDNSMEFHKTLLEANNSVIRDEIFFGFKNKKDLSDFVEKVEIIGHLDSTVIDTDDLAVFAPAVKVYKDVWRIGGDFKGRVNDFTFKNMDLHFGKQSHTQGEVMFTGLPDIEQTFMDLRFKQAYLQAYELNPYIDRPEVSPILQKLGMVDFKGNLTGFFKDFVANGSFKSALGNFDSDINLKIKENQANTYYKGNLNTQSLQLGELLGIPDLIQKIDVKGSIEGTGFTPEFAHFKLDANIKKLGFKGYDYQDITVDGDFSQNRFNGEMIARDKNFDFDIKGMIDLNKDPKNPHFPIGRFDLKSKVHHISLQPLGFMPKETVITGDLNIDTHGLTLDDLTGEAVLSNAFLVYNGKGLNIKDLEFLSFRDDESGNRLFDVRSDFLDLHIHGNYLFSRLIKDLQELAYEYAISFQNNPKTIQTYYKKKAKEKELGKYSLNFDLNLENANPLFQIFDEKVFVAKNTFLQGKFSHGKSNALSLSTDKNIDSVFYGINRLYDIAIDINSSKLAANPEILTEGTISSSKQNWNSAQTENLLLNAVWGDNMIDFNLQVKQQSSTNSADLQGSMKFVGDTTEISFQPSNFQLLDKRWQFSPKNQIMFNSLGVFFNNLNLYKKESPDSQLSLNGAVADSASAPLRLDVREFDILSIAHLAGLEVRGLLNAEIDMKNLAQKPEVKGQIGIENLMYEKVLIGDVDGHIDYHDETEKLGMDLVLYRKGRYIFDLLGTYMPKDANPLNLTADFKRTDLEILEPFAKDFISKLKGTATGKLNIKGPLLTPVVNGDLKLKNGEFKLNYTNTTYDMEGDIQFLAGEIRAKNVILFDQLSNPATLQATIFHDKFQDIYVQAKSQFYDFQLLNLPEKPNSLYYGEAYATGNLKIEGFLNNLQMDINARSRKGTKIFLPLDGYQEVSNQDYIQFVRSSDAKDSTIVKRINLGGLKLNFNLEVNPDADFAIIFDRKTGDMITANGRGNIEMRIDTEGDFNMFGAYTFEKGKYNFTFSNLLRKSFDIQKGSSITFNGDLYQSELDIRALYNKNVSLKSLVEVDANDTYNNRDLTRFYPVKASLDLKGQLLSPEIKLDLDLNEAKRLTTNNPLLQSALLQLETQMIGNEQVRNQQVFSLLILNRLSAINSFAGVGGGAGGSLSELLSNQFSNWISQVDENLELSFNVDPSNFSTFQMRVSYNLLDGRLRITRDGGFTNSSSQANFASLIGDWTLEYLLSTSGKYRIKTYNRTNQNLVNTINLNNASTTLGFSLAHTASFNNFGELFTSRKKREERSKARFEQLKDSLAKDKKENDFIIFEKTETEKTDTKIPEPFKKVTEKPDSLDKMPLKHRESTYQTRKVIAEVLPEETDLNPNKNPETKNIDIDEDNEPIPDEYRERLKNKKIIDNQEIKKNPEIKPIPSNPNAFPLKHRFDAIFTKKDSLKTD